MAKITLFLGDKLLREVPLTKERVTLGRRPYNDIVLDDIAISGEHAVIVTLQHDSFLEDLNSTNGTKVNGQPVKKHYLQDEDRIELARYHICYSAAAPHNDVPVAGPRLQVLSGARAGAETALNKAITSIGKQERHAAVILKRTDGYFLTHVDDSARPLLNGALIGSQPRKLQDGDVISMDGDYVRFVL